MAVESLVSFWYAVSLGKLEECIKSVHFAALDPLRHVISVSLNKGIEFQQSISWQYKVAMKPCVFSVSMMTSDTLQFN